MKQIKGYDCTLYNLSDKEYEVLTNGHPGINKGTIVRLISGVMSSEKVGYHFDPSFRTVCKSGAKMAQFLGVKRSALRVYKGD